MEVNCRNFINLNKKLANILKFNFFILFIKILQGYRNYLQKFQKNFIDSFFMGINKKGSIGLKVSFHNFFKNFSKFHLFLFPNLSLNSIYKVIGNFSEFGLKMITFKIFIENF